MKTNIRQKLVMISYGDLLFENGYKTRILGELSILKDLPDFEKYFLSFEKESSWRQNHKNLTSIQKAIKQFDFNPTITSRKSRWQIDFFWKEEQYLKKYLESINFTRGILHAQSLYAGYLAVRMKQYFDCKVIFDMHGLVEPEIEQQRGFFLKKILAGQLERYCLTNADQIVTASQSLKLHLVINKRTASPIFSLPCYANPHDFSRVKFINLKTRRQKFNLPVNRLIGVYLGGGQSWQEIGQVIDFCRKNKVFLLIITPDQKIIKEYLSAYTDLDYQIVSLPHHRVWQYLQLADFGFLLRQSNPLNRIAFPTKMAEYLLCGLPIIHNGTISDVVKIIDQNNLGLNIDQLEHDSMTSFLSNYAKQKIVIKQRCRQFALENLSWSSSQTNLLSIYRRLFSPKILHMLTTDIWGGAQKYVLDLAIQLKSKGYDIEVASGQHDPDGLLEKRLSPANIVFHPLKHLQRSINPWTDWLAYHEIKQLISDKRYDLVHISSSKAGILGRLAAHNLGVRRIFYTAHGWVFTEKINRLMKKFYLFLEKMAANWCDKIVCVSKLDYKLGLKAGISKSKLITIYNGCDSSIIPEKSHQIPDKKSQIFLKQIKAWQDQGFMVVGTVANFFPPKNLSLFINIAKTVILENQAKIRFVLIGDGPQFSPITKLVDKYQLTNKVLLTGFQHNPYVLMRQFDLFLLTSSKEGFPYVLLEAGSLSIPIIASRVGGVGEIIANQQTGLVVGDYLNQQEYIDDILWCQKHPKQLQVFSDNLHKIIEKKFSHERMMKKYLKLYL